MILATWNVNSIRMREDRLLRWLSTRQPDVLCIQELKCTDEDFPFAKVEELGYHAVVHGQRAYNGVAIVSRTEPTNVVRGIGLKDLDEEARFICATIDGVRVMNAYVPAGGEDMKSPKYPPKIKWLRRMIDVIKEEKAVEGNMVLCGDMNIAAEEKDVATPDRWRNSAVYNDELTAIYQELISLGLHDSFRQHNTDGGLYTWWDYNDLCYQRNEGLRIDHILIPQSCEDHCFRCWVDWEERQGTKPSDHAPLMADFDWTGERRRDVGAAISGTGPHRSRSFVAPADVAFGDEAALSFIRQEFPSHAGALPAETRIRVRFANGFEEILRWNYFPAGARQWTWEGADKWFETTASD